MIGKSRLLLTTGIIVLLGASDLLAQRSDRNRGRRQREPEQGALQVGQLAPTFELASIDASESFRLKEFRGDKPVVLFFGSYT